MFFAGAQVLRISIVNSPLRVDRRVVDHEALVLVAKRHALAVGQHAQQRQLAAVQPERLGGHQRCAGCALARDERLRRVEIETSNRRADPVRRRGVTSSRRVTVEVPSRMVQCSFDGDAAVAQAMQVGGER